MTRVAALLTLLVPVAVLLAADTAPAPPSPAEIRALVTKLGSDEYTEREAATSKLEAIGPAAIEELRAAVASQNAETVRRAQELLRKAERRLVNDRTLAPTLVELDARVQSLDSVLADLSKQAKCDVVLGGLKPDVAAAKKVTIATGGKVPFWTAVLQVCDAGELQVAGASGFVAPGAMPYLGRATAGVRVSTNTQRAVVLEAGGDAPKRPAFVSGAVLVEALPFPKNATPDQPTALLQAWPEPRMLWENTSAVKVVRAADREGAKLPTEVVTGRVMDPIRNTRGGVVIMRNVDGTASVLPDDTPFQLPGNFRPNVRQSVVRFTGSGKPDSAKELDLSLFATVRSPVEPLSRAADLKPNAPATGTGIAGVDLSVTYGPGDKGRLVATVSVTYDPTSVHAANVSDELVGARGGGVGGGNGTVYGIRVTDAEGKPYNLGLTGASNQYDGTGRRISLRATLELHPEKDGHGPPSVVTFWGTHARPVEIPVRLKDVPLRRGK